MNRDADLRVVIVIVFGGAVAGDKELVLEGGEREGVD